MAIRDALTTFAENFDLDQETGSYIFTNQVDLGVAGRDVGNGQPVYVNFAVTETFTDGGDSATLTLQVISDSVATLDDSVTVHAQTAAILKTNLVAGATFSLPLPTATTVQTYERFLGVRAVVGTAGFDAGMITAFLSPDPIQGWKAYADAVN